MHENLPGKQNLIPACFNILLCNDLEIAVRISI